MEQDSINEIYDNQIDICLTKYSERKKPSRSWKTIEDADRECGICPYANAGELNLRNRDRTTCQEIGSLCYSEPCGADKTLFLRDKSKIVVEDNIYIIDPEGQVCFGDTIDTCMAITLVYKGNYKIAAHVNASYFPHVIDEIFDKNTQVNSHNLLYWIKKKTDELADNLGERPILEKVLIFSADEGPIGIKSVVNKDGRQYWIIIQENLTTKQLVTDKKLKNMNYTADIFNERLVDEKLNNIPVYQNPGAIHTKDTDSEFTKVLGTLLGLNETGIEIQFRLGTVESTGSDAGVKIPPNRDVVAPCLLIAANGTWKI